MRKNELEYTTLDQIGTVSRGRSQHRPRNAPHLYGGNIPFIQTADVTKSNLYITQFSQTYTQAGLAQSKLWSPGVLCIANAGVNTGDNAILNFPACFPDSVIGFQADPDKCNVKFIKYFIDSVKKQIRSITMGATQDNLSVGKLITIPIPKVKLKIQNKVAAILSTYDDLIGNNSSRIALLDKMVDEIYREWFVRFRFPNYKSVVFEKGLPKPWELKRVDTLGRVVTGKTPPTSNSKFYGNDIHFIKTPDMHEQSFIVDTEEKLTIEGMESQPSQIIPANSISVSCIGTGGIVSISTQQCCTNQQINTLILKNEFDLSWAFCALKSLKPTIIAFGSTGTTMTNLSKGKFCGLRLIVPPLDLRKRFHKLVEPMLDEIKSLSKENKQLEEQKQLLLPRLISGKLNIEDINIQFPPSMQESAKK